MTRCICTDCSDLWFVLNRTKQQHPQASHASQTTKTKQKQTKQQQKKKKKKETNHISVSTILKVTEISVKSPLLSLGNSQYQRWRVHLSHQHRPRHKGRSQSTTAVFDGDVRRSKHRRRNNVPTRSLLRLCNYALSCGGTFLPGPCQYSGSREAERDNITPNWETAEE